MTHEPSSKTECTRKMLHNINFHTIARTPADKISFAKLSLKKKDKNRKQNERLDFTKYTQDRNSQTGVTLNDLEFNTKELFSTPPFVTKRRKNVSPVKISPLLCDSSNGSVNISNKSDKINSVIEITSSIDEHTTPVRSKSSENEITPESVHLLNALYGDVWKTTPGLFKTKRPVEKVDDDCPVEKLLEDGFKSLTIDRIKETNTELDHKNEKDESSPGTEDQIRYNGENLKPNQLNFDDCDDDKHPVNVESKPTDLNDTVTDITKDKRTLLEKPAKIKSKNKAKPSKKIDKENIEPRDENINAENKLDNNIDIKKQSKYENPSKETLRFGFMASLGDNIPMWRRNEKAKFYRENFKTKKEELAAVLYRMFNENVFGSKLYPKLPIVWNVNLATTAGRAHNKIVRSKDAKGDDDGRRSRIELSSKVVDTTQRLRDTLAHELCHVAAWLIDGNLRDGHGPTWKFWVSKVLARYPEIGTIPVRHQLDIYYKYSYKCMKCGYKINRHSKSIDTNKKRCGYCYGHFECIHNKKTKDGLIVSTPSRTRKEAGGFALFVKENYGIVRSGDTPHKDVMKYLGKQYAEMKKKSNDS